MNMKKDYFETPIAMKKNQFYGFSWIDFVTAIPSPLFVVTTYKSNGKPNACYHSFATFAGVNENEFYCILAYVNKNGHLYKSVKETNEMVLNFPTKEIHQKCYDTIKNNNFEFDEIIESGLTVEKAKLVNAPRIKECFLNLECEYSWERDLVDNGKYVVMCAKVKSVSMNIDHFDEKTIGRYGETGYIFNLHNPTNPETGVAESGPIGIIKKVL
jgi:flavin reductase (DIM6/NTAB) family NADH-FMN oxidoreductase RutF